MCVEEIFENETVLPLCGYAPGSNCRFTLPLFGNTVNIETQLRWKDAKLTKHF